MVPRHRAATAATGTRSELGVVAYFKRSNARAVRAVRLITVQACYPPWITRRGPAALNDALAVHHAAAALRRAGSGRQPAAQPGAADAVALRAAGVRSRVREPQPRDAGHAVGVDAARARLRSLHGRGAFTRTGQRGPRADGAAVGAGTASGSAARSHRPRARRRRAGARRGAAQSVSARQRRARVVRRAV